METLRDEPLAEEIYGRLYGSIDYDALETIAQNTDGIDVLIIEGTNFGRILTPLEPKEFIDLVTKIVAKIPSIISLHVLDLESLLAITLSAYKNGLLQYCIVLAWRDFLHTLLIQESCMN